MGMRTPVVESPIKAPQIEPEIAPEIRFGIKIPSRGEELGQIQKGTEEITSGLKSMNESFEKQAEFTVQNKYEAQLSDLKTNILGRARTYQGSDSFEVAPKAADEFVKGASELGKDIKDQRQKDAFALMTRTYGKDLNEEINKHVATQIPIAYAKGLDDFFAAKAVEAGQISDDKDKIDKILQEVHDKSALHAEYTHSSPELADAFGKAANEQIIDSVITAKKNGHDANGASEFLKDVFNQGMIRETYYKKALNQIAPSVAIQTAKDEWQKNILSHKEFMQPEGQIDKAKVEQYVFNKYNDQTNKSFAVQRDIKTLMQDYNKNYAKGKQNADEAYYNYVLQQKHLREQGKQADSFDQVLQRRNDPQFGPIDEVGEERRRVHAVAYENPKGSKPAILERLHEGILDGTTTQDMIDSALKTGDLGMADALKLEAAKNKYNSGANPQYKAQWNQIRKTSKAWFGRDNDGYDSFMSDFIQGGEAGESVADLKQRFQKAVDNQAKGGFTTRIFHPKPENEIESDKFKSKIGQEAFDLMQSYLPKDYSGNILSEKTDLENEHGMDFFDPGKPGYNAIQSIMNRNKLPGHDKIMPPTKRNIEWILQKNHDGIWSEQ